MTEAVDTKRPAGVPDTARRVTLAELQDEVAGPDGTLRLGPRRSYLRFSMLLWPFGLRGAISRITGGVSTEHGGRVFGLSYAHGTRRPGAWKIVAFTAPNAAERVLWIWDIDQERAWRKAGRP